MALSQPKTRMKKAATAAHIPFPSILAAFPALKSRGTVMEKFSFQLPS
jgi:hypothetical protein